jgi:hypothetical protein
METVGSESLMRASPARAESPMLRLSPWLLALLVASPAALADPIAVHGLPEVEQDLVRTNVDDVILDVVGDVYERVFDEPMATAEPGEEGCSGATYEVREGEGYARVTGDVARCLPRPGTDPGVDDACAIMGEECCDRLGTHCLTDLFVKLFGKLTNRGVVAFCIGTTTTSNGSVEPEVEVGQDCSGAPADPL